MKPDRSVEKMRVWLQFPFEHPCLGPRKSTNVLECALEIPGTFHDLFEYFSYLFMLPAAIHDSFVPKKSAFPVRLWAQNSDRSPTGALL